MTYLVQNVSKIVPHGLDFSSIVTQREEKSIVYDYGSVHQKLKYLYLFYRCCKTNKTTVVFLGLCILKRNCCKKKLVLNWLSTFFLQQILEVLIDRIFFLNSIKPLEYIQSTLWKLLLRQLLRPERSGTEWSRHRITQSTSPALTFPLIALHLSKHVKPACVLTPYSVCSNTLTHSESLAGERITAAHANTRALGWIFPWRRIEQNNMKHCPLSLINDKKKVYRLGFNFDCQSGLLSHCWDFRTHIHTF